ncbi:MAG: hypothetical protein Q9O62_09285 [Ardenticatenia bacterium]|nr:hypothetical protein [Ardenticatenia bacterium]
MTTQALYIYLFGPLELAWGDRQLPPPASPRARSLLAYLLLHHTRPIPRDRLTGIFWPDRPDSRARRAPLQHPVAGPHGPGSPFLTAAL